LLEETLGEEQAADEKLTDVGTEVLAGAVSDAEGDSENTLKKRTNGKNAPAGTNGTWGNFGPVVLAD
jgi:hypothetical protein